MRKWLVVSLAALLLVGCGSTAREASNPTVTIINTVSHKPAHVPFHVEFPKGPVGYYLSAAFYTPMFGVTSAGEVDLTYRPGKSTSVLNGVVFVQEWNQTVHFVDASVVRTVKIGTFNVKERTYSSDSSELILTGASGTSSNQVPTLRQMTFHLRGLTISIKGRGVSFALLRQFVLGFASDVRG